jgi:large subunit ribosomal protein L10
MNRTDKSSEIAAVKANFDRAVSVALLDFQGLSVETVSALRREFKKRGIEYRVVKNTLIRHALKDSPYKSLVGDIQETRQNRPKAHQALRGMTGVAWSYGDPAAAAQVVEAFKKANAEKAAKLNVKTGMVGGELIKGEALAKMPGLKETQGHIVGMLDAPAAQVYAMLLMPGITIAAILDTWVEREKAKAG